MPAAKHARRTLEQPAALVVFDCDSTLSRIEGITELAGEHRTEVERLTDAAMRGEVPLDQVYGRRLELVRPTRARGAEVARAYMERIVDHAAETVAALHAVGVDVRVVSGGIFQAVAPFAAELGIAPEKVAAVAVRFDEQGAYASFDEDAPAARAGGKRDIMRAWRAEVGGPAVLVGDGATDLEARSAVDLFIAFTGVKERPEVVAGADAVVGSTSLTPILPLVLAGREPEQQEARRWYRVGVEILEAQNPNRGTQA
ncbi:MAG: HAD-IB family phosphatase [Gemmatimonadota bacterium]